MHFRSAAWLCLIGAAACSNNNPEPANSAADVNQASTSYSEPAMTPASLETSQPVAPQSPAPAAVAPSTPTTTPAASTMADPQPQAGVSADNTKVNERDRNSANPTPLDQKENETDLKITQRVRQAVMADGSLSFTAKNVKIITQNGKVTLRGPVKTTQERDAIASAARNVAGVTQVENQIEIAK